MDRTVTAVLVAAIMAMSCCVLLVSDEGDAETTTVGTYQDLLDAIGNASAGDTIQLTNDIQIDKMLDITKGITLDLGGHILTSSEAFTGTYDNDKHLVQVQNAKVTIKNGTLKTTEANKQVLNVYNNSNVALTDVTLDHTNAFKGAPLVVNGSSVTLSGKVIFITGGQSWYAINVDSGEGSGSEATLSTADSAELVFEGLKEEAIFISEPESGKQFSVTFGPDTVVRTDIENFVLVNSENDAVNVDVSNVDIVPETEPTPEPTPTPGYDDDEDLPPFIPSQSSNDDTVTIVACAAAAAVAAILAVFLVIDRK